MNREETRRLLEKQMPIYAYDTPMFIALSIAIEALSEPEIIHCKDCRWWEQKEGTNYGYCHAMKHSYYTRNWEISIHRTYDSDFFCADAEQREEVEEDE